MYRLLIRYTNGITSIEFFNTRYEAQWFVNNEGDHVAYYSIEYGQFDD